MRLQRLVAAPELIAVMEPRLSRYIWTHTRAQQLWILMIVALSMVPYFLAFDLPKQIVNGPITGDGFTTPGATQQFMELSFSLPFLGTVEIFSGVPLERMSMLFALSGVFLGLVIVNGLFKFYINTYKGRLGERLLRRVRFELVDRILRFPPETFKRLKGAEISSMVKDEVEPLGGFTGDAFVAPALLGGQALTALGFIFLQNVWLGLITASLVAVQFTIIPRMRRRLLVLGRERQLTARQLAGRVSEIVDGIGTIHAYDTSNLERADIASRLGTIFKIRFDIYQWKFLVKFINNFLASVTPFLFYSVGGYLALNGRLDIGQLVAVIGAYKDLPGPLKDLIDWDQNRQDVQVKYTQVVNQFAIDGLLDPDIQTISDTHDPAVMRQPLAAVNLSLADDSGAAVVDRLNLRILPGELVAVVGDTASGAEAFAEAMGRLVWPKSGKIAAGDTDILTLPEAITGRAMSYAGVDTYFFSGNLRDNLLYGLKHAPLHAPDRDAKSLQRREWEKAEAQRAGNPDFDVQSDWIDYGAAGITDGTSGIDALYPQLRAAFDAVLMGKDVIDLALRSIIDPSRYPGLARDIVTMRTALRQDLDARGLRDLIEPFEPGAYNSEATLGENLLFGTAVGPTLQNANIGNNAYFRSVVTRDGLAEDLFAMGYEIAQTAIELFADLPPDHPFFQQLTFMTSDDIPVYQALLQALPARGFAVATDQQRGQIIRLSFAYVEPRHRFGLLTDELRAKIVAARHQFHEFLPAEMEGTIEMYDPDRYTTSASLLDNVLFGRISQKHADGSDRIQTAARELLEKRGLYQTVFSIGLDFEVGAGGKRLTTGQRQKLNLARALLRRSEYYVFNRPLSGLDQRAQDQIVANALDLLRRDGRDPGVVWVLSSTLQAGLFDRVIVFKDGALVEDGHHSALIEQNGVYKQMMRA